MTEKQKILFGSNQKLYEISNVVIIKETLQLSNGDNISDFPIAYQTYGTLNKERSNAILICPPLTADQFASSNDQYQKHPVTNKDGWWSEYIGPNKAIDTNKFFVICSNVIGGCMGSWGPNQINPKTNQYYGSTFPIITISDIVNAQYLLITTHFKLTELYAVIGASMGGMQALLWSVKYKSMISLSVIIASSYCCTAQNIALNTVGRQSIMSDHNWDNGNYLSSKKFPQTGLSLARMTAHISYSSEEDLSKRFGRNLQDKNIRGFNFETDFQIESYLKYQGGSFTDRFDANSYLYITKAMDYFDLEYDYDNNLEDAFKDSKVNYFIISLSDDWLFPPRELKYLFRKINRAGCNVSYSNIKTQRGHDSFLLPNTQLHNTLLNYINNFIL